MTYEVSMNADNTHNNLTDQLSIPFRLYDLPQELEDMIFEKADSRKRRLNLVFKENWDRDEHYERMSQGPQYVTRAFPSLKVTEWMVSKRFFRAAAKVWMGAQTFHQKAGGNDDLMITEMFLLEQHGLFFEFATHATIKLEPGFRAEFLEDLAPCRTLKHIKLLTDEEVFEPVDKHAKLPWEDASTSKELSRVSELSGITGLCKLKNIRGLQTVKFKVTFSHLINSPSKHKIFADNLTRLLAIAQRNDRRPKPRQGALFRISGPFPHAAKVSCSCD